MSNTNIKSVAMPKQRLSIKRKGKDWREKCVDAVCSKGEMNHTDRSSRKNKLVNYDLANSKTNAADFKHVVDPLGVKDSVENASFSQVRDINVIINKINLLKGEEMNMPFKPMVIAVGGDAVIEKEKRKKDLLLFVAQQKIAEMLGVPQTPMINPETGEQEPPKTFEAVESYANVSMKDIREIEANAILEYMKHDLSLKSKFNQGWEHGLIAAEEIYHVGIVNGNPSIRCCNPVNCDFDKNPDLATIQQGDWFREERYMSSGQIFDELGEFLSEADIDKIENGSLHASFQDKMLPGFAYTSDDPYNRSNNRSGRDTSHFLVNYVTWRSLKKVGFVTYPNPMGEDDTGMVDESFVLTPEMKAFGYTIEWQWIPEIWQGVRIENEIYCNIGPLPNQARSVDNPRSVSLPYIGRLYNSTNSIQTSLVDLIKPHQYLLNIVWYRLENEIARAKGKKMIMDMAQIPRSEGFDLDKWMYFFDEANIALINSFEEGQDKFQGQISKFNQFQSVDLTLSQSVGQYIQIIDKIEMTIDKMIGITPQREGSTSASETASGIASSVNQSSNITKPWYYVHNEVIKDVCSYLLEVAKLAYTETKKINYILDDVIRVNMEIDVEKFANSDYGVFMTDSIKDFMVLGKMEGLANQAIASGAAGLTDAIKMYSANSVAELSKDLQASELKRQEQEQMQQQSTEQMQQQALQAQQQETEAARMFEAEQNQLDRDNEIRKATISAMSFDTDTQDNNQIDVLGQEQLSLSQSEADNRKVMEKTRLNSENDNKEKDRQLKRQEIQSKEKIEKLKARTALKNKVSGEK